MDPMVGEESSRHLTCPSSLPLTPSNVLTFLIENCVEVQPTRVFELEGQFGKSPSIILVLLDV